MAQQSDIFAQTQKALSQAASAQLGFLHDSASAFFDLSKALVTEKNPAKASEAVTAYASAQVTRNVEFVQAQLAAATAK